MPAVRYLLWDFGDTLVDQRWMWPSPPGVPGWTAHFRAFADTALDERWLRGELTTEELAARFAADLAANPDILMTHMEARCRDVQFFEHTWAVAQARRYPQAIVTLNPDAFSRFIVPEYGLDSAFDAVVTSWEEHTLSKARLCEIALARLGGTDPSEALLIDNVDANVDAWRACGGQAYLFTGDDDFARDSTSLLEHA